MKIDRKAGSQYLGWAKNRKPARYNLSASSVVPYSLDELQVRIEDMELNGPGLYGYPPLQAMIAAHCGVPEDCLVGASGASMANFLALAALIEPDDEVLVEEPAYEPLIAAVQFLRGSIKRLKRDAERNFELPVPDGFISERTKLIILTNLHNPTFAGASDDMLRRYAEAARRVHARILIDEIYLECTYRHVRSAFHHGPEFVVTSSLTKAYGLGGLRCGWIVADPELAERIWKLKDLIDPSAPHVAECLSVHAFQQLPRIADRAKALLDRNRGLVREFLNDCERLVCALPEYGTCIFPRFDGDCEQLIRVLYERYETDVVPGRFFGMPDHFRLGFGMATETLAAGLERLTAAMKEL